MTSAAEAIRLAETADNDNLKCEIVKNSSHLPGREGMDRVFEKLFLFEQ